MSHAPSLRLVVATIKLKSLVEIYTPHVGRAAAIAAFVEAIDEFDAATREDERLALKVETDVANAMRELEAIGHDANGSPVVDTNDLPAVVAPDPLLMVPDPLDTTGLIDPLAAMEGGAITEPAKVVTEPKGRKSKTVIKVEDAE